MTRPTRASCRPGARRSASSKDARPRRGRHAGERSHPISSLSGALPGCRVMRVAISRSALTRSPFARRLRDSSTAASTSSGCWRDTSSAACSAPLVSPRASRSRAICRLGAAGPRIELQDFLECPLGGLVVPFGHEYGQAKRVLAGHGVRLELHRLARVHGRLRGLAVAEEHACLCQACVHVLRLFGNDRIDDLVRLRLVSGGVLRLAIRRRAARASDLSVPFCIAWSTPIAASRRPIPA